ncbi:hypothetical protein Taro_007683 [Colocasia esculenta]|uniref:Uncharacterized protein n=1 Tax=Colocasia esculenta TaxID=4460 RepID=A0A843TUW2_COLES|nr:hypothetical protein [Colocasia esculenta]
MVRLSDYVGCPDDRGRESSSSGGGGGSASWTPAMLDFWTNFRKSLWEARDKAAKIADSQDPTAWMDYGLVWMRRDYWESLCHRWATGPQQERSQAAKRNQEGHPENNVHTSGSVSYATHSQKLCHELECALTFCELFDRTHKWKGTDDYVNESAHTIVETYDRTMANRYAKGTP